jgi:hypothetical protein
MIFGGLEFVAIGALGKLLGGGAAKVAVTKGAAALGAKGAAASTHSGIHATHASMHAAHIAHTAAIAGGTSPLVIIEGVGYLTLGAVGLHVLQKLLRGRKEQVGPTGEKIAGQLAYCVEKDALSEGTAELMMQTVEVLPEYKRLAMKKELDDIFVNMMKS